MMQDNPQDSLSAALKPGVPERHFRPQPALLLSALALLLAGGFGLYQFQSAQTLKRELEQSRSLSNKASQDLQALQQDIAARHKQLDSRLALLEARQAEAHSQQQALATLSESLTRSDTARTLAEIEQALTFASQQLQLTGNVAGALVTISDIDQKLTELNRPELISLRQAVSRDRDALKALPATDVYGITLTLDNLAGMIDRLPMTVDSYREPAKPAPRTGGDTLTRFAAELWHELNQLIQIRRMDRPDALLLSPEQAFFVRENIKLRLQNARIALLSRNPQTYQADLKLVLGHLRQHFDKRSPQTAAAATELEQLINQPLALKLPDLGASLAAVRNARSVAERAKP